MRLTLSSSPRDFFLFEINTGYQRRRVTAMPQSASPKSSVPGSGTTDPLNFTSANPVWAASP